MLEFLTPLGRPPLDTYSPTQVVRTAEPMPAGVWEVEAGGHSGDTSSVIHGIGGLRVGIWPGVELDAAFVPFGNGRQARRSVGLRVAPIPALWSVDAAYDLPGVNGQVQAWELGSTFELAFPWLTPRVAPRLTYRHSTGRGSDIFTWLPRLAVGAETRALRGAAFGADLDLGINDPSSLSLGARFRVIGNLGCALFASYFWPGQATILPAPATVIGGALAALRF